MDDADKSQILEDLALERAIAAARGVPSSTTLWQHCHDCAQELPEHRQRYGLCVPCKTRREEAMRRMAVGV